MTVGDLRIKTLIVVGQGPVQLHWLVEETCEELKELLLS